MKKLIADLHTHTIVSGHAYGTIREMAQAAGEQGLALLGLTEHAPGIPGTVDPFYYNNLAVIPRTLYGVELAHGSEINVLNGGRTMPSPASTANATPTRGARRTPGT